MSIKNINNEGLFMWELNKIFFAVMDGKDFFCAEDIQNKAQEVKLNPQMLNRVLPGFFKSMIAANYVTKTDRYKLSEKGSRVLPLYTKKISKSA